MVLILIWFEFYFNEKVQLDCIRNNSGGKYSTVSLPTIPILVALYSIWLLQCILAHLIVTSGTKGLERFSAKYHLSCFIIVFPAWCYWKQFHASCILDGMKVVWKRKKSQKWNWVHFNSMIKKGIYNLLTLGLHPQSSVASSWRGQVRKSVFYFSNR